MNEEKEKKIRLVAADVDGTLVDDARVFRPRTRRALEALHAGGVLFGIASGRQCRQLRQENAIWSIPFPFDFVIGMNGGEIYIEREHRQYSYYLLSPETIEQIIRMMEPLHQNPSMYGPGSDFRCLYVDEATLASEKRNQSRHHIVKDLAEFWVRPEPKIMYRVAEEEMPEVEAWIAAHPSPDYKAVKTQTTMVEFVDPHVDKGLGLRKVSEKLDIPLAVMMAFGDMDNDISLLQQAGTGVCMCNGSAATKAAADFISDYSNNEDGFARFLEDHYPELVKPL